MQHVSSVTIVVNLFILSFSIVVSCKLVLLVPVAASCNTWICCRSPIQNVGSNPTEENRCLSVVNVVRCQVEISVSGADHLSRGILPNVLRRCV